MNIVCLPYVRSFYRFVLSKSRRAFPRASSGGRYKRRASLHFSDREIQQLMEAAARNRLRFRAATVSTLIGLLASTGIRIGEALRLTMADVRLDAKPSHLYIHETKFGKSRNVVLHTSTVEHLRHYIDERATALRGRSARTILHQHDLPTTDL